MPGNDDGNDGDLAARLAALQVENERLQAAVDNQQRNTGVVNRVAVKLPPFWADRPSLWFSQAESQFLIAGITADATKFHHVVSQLDTRYAAEVEDIITTPPATNKYAALKEQLIARLSASEEQRVRQLLGDEELGDRKPSQFLRHLQNLAGSTQLEDKLLRQLWIRRLPSNVQAILSSQPKLSLADMADIADKIVEVSPPPPPLSVNAVSSSTNDDLLKVIAALSKKVDALSESRHRGRSRSRSRSRSSPTSSSDSSRSNNDDYCSGLLTIILKLSAISLTITLAIILSSSR